MSKRIKSKLTRKLVQKLYEEGYSQIDFNYEEVRHGSFFVPNILAYKSGKLYLFDVKHQLTDKIDFVRSKWKFFGELARNDKINFAVGVPKDKVPFVNHLLKKEQIESNVVPL